jgi:hypothetical protein
MWGDEHVDDLAELVDRPAHLARLAGDHHMGLVDPPMVPDRMAARPSSLGQQRREPLHPRRVIELAVAGPRRRCRYRPDPKPQAGGVVGGVQQQVAPAFAVAVP